MCRTDKNRFLKTSAAVTVFLLILAFCSTFLLEDSLTLTILHTNDHHGHTLAYTYQGKNIGGLAERMTLIKRLKGEAASTTDMYLLVDAGDISSGTLFSDFFDAEPDWKVYARFYDAIVLGNHDFDFPFDRVFSLIKTFQAPVLSANLYDRRSNDLFFPPYKIFRNGNWSLAIIGISHPETPLISTLGNDERLEFHPAGDTSRQAVQELRDDHDLIIVLSHLGEDDRLAKEVQGIDLIIGGHSHSPLKKALKVKKTLIVNAGFGGQFVGRLELSLRRQKRGVAVRLIDYDLLPVPADLPPDEEVHAMLQPYLDSYGERGKTVVGEAGDAFTRTPLAGPMSTPNIANLVTDAYRFATGTDFAFVNKGGLRADLDKGPVTIEEIHSVLPFDNTLIVFQITGKQIMEIIQGMVSGQVNEDGILFPSNLKIVTQKQGPAEVRTGEGEPLDLDKLFSVAVASFIARGGDGHQSFLKLEQKRDTMIRTEDALRKYFEAKGTIYPDNEPRLR